MCCKFRDMSRCNLTAVCGAAPQECVDALLSLHARATATQDSASPFAPVKEKYTRVSSPHLEEAHTATACRC